MTMVHYFYLRPVTILKSWYYIKELVKRTKWWYFSYEHRISSKL